VSAASAAMGAAFSGTGSATGALPTRSAVGAPAGWTGLSASKAGAVAEASTSAPGSAPAPMPCATGRLTCS
jgi:hypothetical protein